MFTYLEQAMNGIGANRLGGLSTVSGIVNLLASIFVAVAVGLSIISIAYAFIQFIVSTGDEKLLQKAQTSALWGVLGFIIASLAFVLKNVLLGAAGVAGVN
jgi:hypothetical protein